MAEQAFHGRTPLQQNENDRTQLQRLQSSTYRYELAICPSSSSYASSSTLTAAAVHAERACLMPSSRQESAGLPSSSEAHATAEAYHHHHHHQERYDYLQLIDELRTCGRLKAEIVAHPLFHSLLQAHVQCLSVGVPSQQLPALEAQLAGKNSVILKYVMLGNGDQASRARGLPGPALARTAEIDAFMENYLQLLMAWKKRFLPATMDALSTLSEMEQSFREVTGDSFNLQEAAALADDGNDEEMEDLSCGDVDYSSKCDMDQALLEHVRMELKHKLKESYKESIMAMHEEILRKRQAGKLPGDITALKRWWDAHSRWPYPTEVEKRKLVEETGLEMRQVNNWFINHRKRNWIERCSPPTTSQNLSTSSTGFSSQNYQNKRLED